MLARKVGATTLRENSRNRQRNTSAIGVSRVTACRFERQSARRMPKNITRVARTSAPLRYYAGRSPIRAFTSSQVIRALVYGDVTARAQLAEETRVARAKWLQRQAPLPPLCRLRRSLRSYAMLYRHSSTVRYHVRRLFIRHVAVVREQTILFARLKAPVCHHTTSVNGLPLPPLGGGCGVVWWGSGVAKGVCVVCVGTRQAPVCVWGGCVVWGVWWGLQGLVLMFTPAHPLATAADVMRQT